MGLLGDPRSARSYRTASSDAKIGIRPRNSRNDANDLNPASDLDFDYEASKEFSGAGRDRRASLDAHRMAVWMAGF